MFVEYKVNSIGPGPVLSSKYHLDPCVAYNVVHSWAVPFREYVLKNINEGIFKCLYSTGDSRPNFPVRILLSFCILACYLNEPFKELHAELVTDTKVRYALDLMDFNPSIEGYEDMDLSECVLVDYAPEEYSPNKYYSPFSIQAVQRFLRKNERYYLLTGGSIDLIHIALEDLFRKMALVLEIDGKTVRIDSMMVASYTKKMSRKELLYVSNAMFARHLNEIGHEPPEGLQHYLRSDDHNLVMYHLAKKEKEEAKEKEKEKAKREKEKAEKGKDGNEESEETEETEDSLACIIREAQELAKFGLQCKCGRSSQYKLHKRIMEEQLIDDGNGGLRLRKKGEGMNSSIVQSLYDLDATYREKNNKPYRGYSANLVEALGGWGTILTAYDLEQNTYSDLQFYRDYLKNYVDLDRFNGIPENLDALPTLAKLEQLAHDAEEARLRLEAAQAENTDDQAVTDTAVAEIAEGQTASSTCNATDDQAVIDTAAAVEGQTAPSACAVADDHAVTDTTAATVAEGQTAPSACDVADGQAVTDTAADAAEGQTAPSACAVADDQAVTATIAATVSEGQTAPSACAVADGQAVTDTTADAAEGRTAPSVCDVADGQTVQVTAARNNTPTDEKLTMSTVPKIPEELLAPLFEGVYPQVHTGSAFPLPETDKDYCSLVQSLVANNALLKQLNVADAAFFSVPVAFEALLRGVLLIPTNLTGKSGPEFNVDFVFSMDGKNLIACPAGQAPYSCTYCERNGTCTAKFQASQCANCPHFDKCKPRATKAGFSKSVTQISKIRAVFIKLRGSGPFSTATRFRNGIEPAPSVLRRKHDVDHMQARGKHRVRIFFGFRVAALNVVKLLKGLQRKASGERVSLDDFSP